MNNTTFESIFCLQEKPEPFSPGEALFWDDPHISAQMLQAHLNPNNDLASRRPETIRRSVEWLVATLDLQPGVSLLDPGCGPGLYAMRLAKKELCVTGVYYSRRSIEYATQVAQQNDLDIEYRYQDYRPCKTKTAIIQPCWFTAIIENGGCGGL